MNNDDEERKKKFLSDVPKQTHRTYRRENVLHALFCDNKYSNDIIWSTGYCYYIHGAQNNTSDANHDRDTNENQSNLLGVFRRSSIPFFCCCWCSFLSVFFFAISSFFPSFYDGLDVCSYSWLEWIILWCFHCVCSFSPWLN